MAERRLDVVDDIGAVVDAVIGGDGGVRPAAEALNVPHTTARGWVRRFRRRAALWAIAFGALLVELGGDPFGPSRDTAVDAVGAIGAAFVAASGLAGWAALGRWRFASTVCGAGLLAANTNPPWLVIGSRRFMPPVPPPGV